MTCFEEMTVWTVATGLLTAILCWPVIRMLEKIGNGGIVFLPVIGFVIGSSMQVAGTTRSPLLFVLAGGLTYVSAMLTHSPSAYEMFRVEFGASSSRSVLLALSSSLRYPLEAALHIPFYGVMLLLAVVTAGWATVR